MATQNQTLRQITRIELDLTKYLEYNLNIFRNGEDFVFLK